MGDVAVCSLCVFDIYIAVLCLLFCKKNQKKGQARRGGAPRVYDCD